MALKKNQEGFYNEVEEYFDEDKLLIIESGYEGGFELIREKSHNEIITYKYYQTEDVEWYEDK